MTTLRFLLILLLILNALAFGAIKGWLGFAPPMGEPERITNQLHPDRIRLLGEGESSSPRPAPAVVATPTPPATNEGESAPSGHRRETPAAPAASICVAWSGLNESDADRLSARLTAAGLTPRQRSTEVPTSWWVRIPPLPNREAAERRMKEVRSQGVTDLFIVQEPGPNQFAISLGLFKTETSSRQHLAQMRAKGVRNADIVVRTGIEYRIEAEAEPSAFDAIAPDPTLDGRRTECTP